MLRRRPEQADLTWPATHKLAKGDEFSATIMKASEPAEERCGYADQSTN